MTVMDDIMAKLGTRKLHFTLIDPDKQDPAKASRMACAAHRAGTDAIMIGGSTGYSADELDATVVAIKENCPLPVILFPTSAGLLSPHIDAIFFMSMLNSCSCDYLIREHAKAAPYIQKLGIEPISMGYLIVEPGMRVAEVGQAECVPRADTSQAIGYAMAAEMLGMSMVYLEAGSGSPEPVPPEMVRGVSEAVSVPVIAGGGITKPEHSKAAVDAGADIVVTGTVVERSQDVERVLEEIIRAMRE
ncbi:MAG: geranylgeranylglyceryl/heptaprenylglyceryl phosphate synthase [Thermoplasmata archaeon]|nr:MAG: geranylgeranylglyceryl/heptaprenylglyceryl phosphate synthase [Thermoplasmata archaeon]